MTDYNFENEYFRTLTTIGSFFIPWEEREDFDPMSTNYLLAEGVSVEDAIRVLTEDNLEARAHDSQEDDLYSWAERHPELFADY